MNQVKLVGSFTKEFELSHKLKDKSFYISEMSIPRQSGAIDAIPVILESSVLPIDISNRFYLHGSFRVFNKHNRSYKYVYSDCIVPTEEKYLNEIELEGTLRNVCRRTTPLGRKLTDAMLDVPRLDRKDSIPLIFWNTMSDGLNAGDLIHIKGRIQSRTYEKDGIIREINEVSVSKIL